MESLCKKLMGLCGTQCSITTKNRGLDIVIDFNKILGYQISCGDNIVLFKFGKSFQK